MLLQETRKEKGQYVDTMFVETIDYDTRFTQIVEQMESSFLLNNRESDAKMFTRDNRR